MRYGYYECYILDKDERMDWEALLGFLIPSDAKTVRVTLDFYDTHKNEIDEIEKRRLQRHPVFWGQGGRILK